VTESCHDVTGKVGGVIAAQVESCTISAKNGEKSFRCGLSGVVEGRNEFHVGGEAADDDEYVEMAATRGRKGAKSVNCNSNKGLIRFRRRELRDRDGRARLVLLAVTTRLDEVDDM